MEVKISQFMEPLIKQGGIMRTFIPIILLSCFIMGCEQPLDDPDNAYVSGIIYQYAFAIDSVYVDTGWIYTDWEFSNPVESVQVWIEGDINSSVPYQGPDIQGYTNSEGLFSVPVYLGQTLSDNSITGYDFVEYADVRVFAVFKGNIFDFGGGLTVARGKDSRLFPIALTWFLKPWSN